MTDLNKILTELEEDAKYMAEKFGKNSEDDWGSGFTEREFSERILKLSNALRVAIEDLSSLENICQDFKLKNFIAQSIQRIQSILKEKE